jgi:hypothetical protein
MPTISRKRYLPKVLIACSNPRFEEWEHHKFVGRLLTPPLTGSLDVVHPYTCMDNFAYSNWQPHLFLKLLNKYKAVADSIKWVACPDVVGDWRRTLDRFEGWNYMLESQGYKRAYVLQDGQPIKCIPWDQIVCVFLGGTDDYKMSKLAKKTLWAAKKRGKLVHVGRVNSIKRINLFIDVMDSFDGLTYSRFNRTHLQPVLDYLESRI